ncbi:MAG: ferric reductase-like transmembrane domain-containing protein [Patescibacteria group bacterium]
MLLKNNIRNKIIVLGLALFWLLPAPFAFAQGVKDTDFDGLTDQGENRIFLTNPTLPDTDGDGYLDSAEILMGSDPLDLHDPEVTFALQRGTAKPQEIPWPWYIARAAGLAGYFILFIMVILGISIQTRIAYKIIKPVSALALHRFMGIALSITMLAHIISLLFDKYLKFTIIDVLVPLVSPFKPVYMSLGIIGLYLLSAVIITSLFLRIKWPRLWRLLHYLTYPIFLLFFLHGVLIGTDTALPLMTYAYWITGLIASAFVFFRLYRYWRKIQLTDKILTASQYEKVS